MTKKETLIREYFALKHRFDLNEPGCSKVYPSEPTPVDIRYMSKEFKVVDLEEKIEYVKRAIEEQKFEKKKAEFFATTEGAKMYDNLHSSINALRECYTNTLEIFKKEITNEIVSFLGSNFGCHVSSNEIEIGVVEKNSERLNKGFDLKFGHTFSVRFNDFHYKAKENYLEVNYPTMGSFTMDDTDRIDYISGMAKFLGNKALQELILEKFNTLKHDLYTIDNEISENKRKLNNPF